MTYTFSAEQRQRLINGLQAATAIPFIDDIEDFVVESILAYAKDIDIPDPFFETRSKRLFDVVDTNQRVGWSVKSLQCPFTPLGRIELVIQRADIFKKAEELGFPSLSKDSSPADLGVALLRHWNRKINEDSSLQNVSSRRIFMLLKRADSFEYSFVEEDIKQYDEDSLVWKWTDRTKTGLQGWSADGRQLIYRWYPGQKQFFEGFYLPAELDTFSIHPVRLKTAQAVHLLLEHLPGTGE